MISLLCCTHCQKEIRSGINEVHYEIKGYHVGKPCDQCFRLETEQHIDSFCNWECLKAWMATAEGWHS